MLPNRRKKSDGANYNSGTKKSHVRETWLEKKIPNIINGS